MFLDKIMCDFLKFRRMLKKSIKNLIDRGVLLLSV